MDLVHGKEFPINETTQKVIFCPQTFPLPYLYHEPMPQALSLEALQVFLKFSVSITFKLTKSVLPDVLNLRNFVVTTPRGPRQGAT